MVFVENHMFCWKCLVKVIRQTLILVSGEDESRKKQKIYGQGIRPYFLLCGFQQPQLTSISEGCYFLEISRFPKKGGKNGSFMLKIAFEVQKNEQCDSIAIERIKYSSGSWIQIILLMLNLGE